MGDSRSPSKKQVMDRLRERLERCRKHQELSLYRYDSTRDERWSHERQGTDALFQRYQDNRSKRQPKGPKQDSGQNKTKNEANVTGSGGGDGIGVGRQQSMVRLKSCLLLVYMGFNEWRLVAGSAYRSQYTPIYLAATPYGMAYRA